MRNNFKSTQNKIILTDVLRKGDMSIAQLLRKTGMKRATCIYYLNQLEAEGMIKKERIEEGTTGRPTIIKFQEEAYQKRRGDFNKKIKEQQKTFYLEIANKPLTKKILSLIKQNPKVDFLEILNHEDIKNYVHKFELTDWLHRQGFIKESFVITRKGEAFLKSHSGEKSKKEQSK